MATPLLLLDPDPRIYGESLAALEGLGLSVRVESDRETALELLAAGGFELVLAEARLFGDLLPSGAQGLQKWILLDTFAGLTGGLGARQRGAFDVLPRPASAELLLLAVKRALEGLATERELAALRSAGQVQAFGPLTTRSARLSALFELCRRVASTGASVLITGESGTGKSELARALHSASPRADRPFVEVHCGALAGSLLESELFGHAAGAFTGARATRAGKFEAADGGSLFLDELATASLDLQIKLLRVLETGQFERVGENTTRRVDVRLIAATNVDLAGEVAAGRFREDLFWRIQVVALELPSLRERPEDVELLARRFLERARERHGRGPRDIDPAAIELLRRHPWPGNVRELRQAMERAALLCSAERLVEAELSSWWRPLALPAGRRPAAAPEAAPALAPRSGTLPAPLGAGPPRSSLDLDAVPLGPLAAMLELPERRFLERALAAVGGSRVRAAELLGINRSTLFNKLRKHGLQPPGAGSAEGRPAA
jgi:two-component system response regulator HydG